MKIAKKLIVGLSYRARDDLIENLTRTCKVFRTGVWEMLFLTLEFMGVDIQFSKYGLVSMDPESLSSMAGCR